MKLFNFLQTKASAAGAALVMFGGQARWSKETNKAYAQEGYRDNVVAYQAINRIADAVASVKWTLWRNDQEVVSHPLLDLLANPNPQQSGPQYMRAKVGYLLIYGNSYEERVDVQGNARELYQLRPDRVKITPDTSGQAKRYAYTVGSHTVNFDVDARGYCAVRHLRLFNPLDDFYGLSPVSAGSYGVDQHNESMRWMQALLRNSATPSGALVSDKDTDMTDEQFNRLKTQMQDQYEGAKNAGKTMLLEGGLKWQAMSLSPDDMSILETKNSAARDICLAFGVPPQMLGIPGDNTYSNYQEARLAFWEDTIIPMLELIAADWTASLAESQGLTIKPDLDQVPAIADKRMTLWTMADNATDLTINERRALKGYEPIDGGDTLLVDLGKMPINDAILPVDEGVKMDNDLAGRLAYGSQTN